MRIGVVLLTVGLAACGDDAVHHLPDAPTGPIPEAARGIYITQDGAKIAVFALDATGDAAPIRTLSGAMTGLSVPIGFDVEPGTGYLYVANRTGSSVTVYSPESTGNVPPVKTLTAPGMGSPEGVVFAPSGELFVSTCPSCGTGAGGQSGVFHFASGALTSDRTLGGATNAMTGFTNPGSIAIDRETGIVVVGNSFGGNVSSFTQDATGDSAPLRSFVPMASNLQSLGVGAGTIFVADPGGAGVIQMYPLTATGSPTPATINNGGMLNVSYPGGVAVDLVSDPPAIYIADYFGNKLHVIHLAGAAPSYTIASVDVIAGTSTGIAGPLGVHVIR